MRLRVREIVSEILDVDLDEVDESIDRQDVDGWDSLNQLRIITALEAEFDVSFTMEEIEKVRTTGDLADVVERHLAGT